jgi:deazaflavin-dependent oxidoreductase (nitroreductase family)
LRPVRRIIGPIEAAETRWFGRSILSLIFRNPVLILETKGRVSGKRRRTVVAYHELDGEVAVVAGAGGETRVPDWVRNLRAEPNVVVTRNRKSAPMRARELSGDERAAAWERLLPVFPQIDGYQRNAGYEIAVVLLSPGAPSG